MTFTTHSPTSSAKLSAESSFKEQECSLPGHHATAERRLKRKLDLRIVLPSFVIYLFTYLDRSNISNARILNHSTNDSLNDKIHFKDHEYAIMLMSFLIGYTIFDIPSNILLKKFQPSRWIAFLTFSCGAITMGVAAVHTYPALAGIRFLLGIFEAGIFPGLVYFITFWYKPSERASRIAFIASASKLSGAAGGMISFGVGKLNRLQGLEGWRWLFLLEGIPGCLLGILIYLFYPDFPEKASWLSESERELALSRLQDMASQGHAKITKEHIFETLVDWRLYGHYAIYLCNSITASTLFLFAPSIVNGLGFKDLYAQLFTVPPYALSFLLSISVSYSAAHFRALSLHAFVSMLIASICFLAQGLLSEDDLIPRYVLLCVAACAAFSPIPILLAWLSGNSRSTGASAVAIGLNSSFGALGQIIGVWIYKDSESPRYITGHMTNFAVLLCGSIFILVLRVVYLRRNAKLSAGSKPWEL